MQMLPANMKKRCLALLSKLDSHCLKAIRRWHLLSTCRCNAVKDSGGPVTTTCIHVGCTTVDPGPDARLDTVKHAAAGTAYNSSAGERGAALGAGHGTTMHPPVGERRG